MTLNIAWLDREVAFLASDTAATTRAPPISETSSLGQRQVRDDGYSVQEGFAKLVPLGTHAAAALCGDGRGATLFVRDTLRRLERGDRLQVALQAAGHNLHHETPPVGHFVVSVVAWDGKAKILQYDSTNLQLTEPQSDVVVEGSLGGASLERVHRAVLGLPRGRVPPHAKLAGFLSILQSLGASENLVSQSVGGIFYGLGVDAQGVHWQPDTTYVFFNNNGPPFESSTFNPVSCAVLDEVCAVGSSLNRQITCLVHPGASVDMVKWLEKWGDGLNARSFFERSRIISFVRGMGNSIVVLPNDGRHAILDYSSGEPMIATSPELAARLAWRPTEERPFRFDLGSPENVP